MLTATQQKLAAVESELGSTRAEQAELHAALADLRAEVKTLEGVRDVDLATLPAADMRVSIADIARAQTDLPLLKRSVREIEKRVNSSAQRISLLDRSRMRLETAIIGEEAAGMLVTSKGLAGAMRALEEAAALWPNPSSQGGSTMGQRIAAARRELETLLKTAQDMA